MKWLPWALVVILLVVGNVGFGWLMHGQRERDQRIAARETVIAALAKQKARVDTVKAQAKIVYVGLNNHWDSIKVDLKDPVKIIATADSVIKACSVVVLSCEAQVAVRDSIIAQKDTLISDLKKPKPFIISIGKPGLGGFVLGALTVLLLK